MTICLTDNNNITIKSLTNKFFILTCNWPLNILALHDWIDVSFISLWANVNSNQLWRESKFCIWSPVPQVFASILPLLPQFYQSKILRSLPGQSCQFLLPAFYQYFTIGTKYIVILLMNYHYFTTQNKLHKITSILPKSLVKLLNGSTGKILVKT